MVVDASREAGRAPNFNHRRNTGARLRGIGSSEVPGNRTDRQRTAVVPQTESAARPAVVSKERGAVRVLGRARGSSSERARSPASGSWPASWGSAARCSSPTPACGRAAIPSGRVSLLGAAGTRGGRLHRLRPRPRLGDGRARRPTPRARCGRPTPSWPSEAAARSTAPRERTSCSRTAGAWPTTGATGRPRVPCFP